MKYRHNNRRRKSRVTKASQPAPPDSMSDDDSVDSKGNIRGLIDYDYNDDDGDSDSDFILEEDDDDFEDDDFDDDEEDDADDEDVPITHVTKKRKVRAAAAKAMTLIREMTLTDEPSIKTPPARTPKQSPELIPLKPRSRIQSRVEQSDDEDEEEDESEEEEEDEDVSMEDELPPGVQTFSINIGGAGLEDDRMVPKRHNMKKETPDVKEFVELITKPVEENDIDNQIDFFKSLEPNKKNQLLEALKKRPTNSDSSMTLMFKILTMKIEPHIRSLVLSKYQALQSLDAGSTEYYKLRNWLDKFTSIPFGEYTDMPVRIEDGHERCSEFMMRARKCLDESTFGQDEAKLQILQFIASKITNPNSRGLSLLLIGPPGVGKTTLIKNGIAKALGWPFQFISLGGDSDASTYTGHQLVYESSHSGKIVNSIVAAKSMSMVLMFDEVDKISQTPKGEEVGNMLIHLTDPVQNSDFEDKYLANIPIDLGKVMFVFSANDINKIDKVLLDRMQVVHLAGYSAAEKVAIAQNYLLPASLNEVNLNEKVGISRDIIEYIIDKYAKSETGVREMKRCLDSVVQKINMLRIYNDKSLPFHIPGFSLPFVVKKEHVDLFLKRREAPKDEPPMGMYI
jgi:Cdc6-like AAA superfamily ATPase